MNEDAQQLLATSFGSGAVAAPVSGATITLWSSIGNVTQATQGARYKRIIASIYSSHASAANGLSFQESVDATNWREVIAYSISAATYTKSYVSMSAPFLRVRYTNSASTLTTWEMSVLGDQDERASQ
jgi:hypothetical protein